MFLVIDDEIRFWVIVPIAIIAVVVSLVKIYLLEAIQNKKKLTYAEIQKISMVQRINNILNNGFMLGKKSLELRRYQFNDTTCGYLSCYMDGSAQPASPSPFQDPNTAVEMLKGSTIGMMPMIIIGAIINYMFSGFIATRVPFSLNNNFRAMLQSSIEGVDLDPSWVSSVSWYLLALFGTQDIIAYLCECDSSFVAANSMMTMSQPTQNNFDNPAIFKALWETLEVYEPQTDLSNIEQYCLENNVI